MYMLFKMVDLILHHAKMAIHNLNFMLMLCFYQLKRSHKM